MSKEELPLCSEEHRMVPHIIPSPITMKLSALQGIHFIKYTKLEDNLLATSHKILKWSR